MKRNKVLCKIISVLFLYVMGCQNIMGQLYYPTSVKSAFFNNSEKFLTEGGINNYAIDWSLNYRINILALSVQYDYNNGNLDINPLNFYSSEVLGIESHRIQSEAKSTKYGEFKISYTPKLEKSKLEIGIGMGRNWILNKNRYFAQIGLGNENKFIDAGVTIRGSYVEKLFGLGVFNSASTTPKNLVVLEPSVIGRIKIGKFRIINQFGFAIIAGKNEDYMKPNFRIGIGYKY